MSEPTGGAWPFEPEAVRGPGEQMVRVNLPLSLLTDHPVILRMAITEREAREIVNTGPEVDDVMGTLYVALKDGLREFLRQEG